MRVCVGVFVCVHVRVHDDSGDGGEYEEERLAERKIPKISKKQWEDR